MNRFFLYMMCAVYCSAIVGMDDKKLIGGVPVGALQKKYAAVLLKNGYKKQSSTLTSKWFAAARNTVLRLIDKAKYNTESVYLWTMPRQSDGSYDLFDCSLGCLEICLRHGASVNARKESGILKEWTPLYGALVDTDLSRVKLLLEHKADVNMQVDGQSHLFKAWDVESLKLMLEAGGNPNVRHAGISIKEWTPLYSALVGKDLQKIKVLLEHKADVNMQVDGVSHLFEAWDAESLKLMLEAGGEPNVRNAFEWTPLHGALVFKDLPRVKLLLEHKADVNMQVYGASHLFSAWDAQSLKLMLKAGGNPNEIDTRKKSALKYFEKKPPIQRQLILFGAQPTDKQTQDLYNSISRSHRRFPFLIQYKKTLGNALEQYIPVADVATLTLDYLAHPEHFNLYLQTVLNQQKVQKNLAQVRKRIEDLNKTLPPERRRTMPPHLLTVADATNSISSLKSSPNTSFSAKEKNRDYDEVKRDENGKEVLPRSTSPAQETPLD